MRNTEIMIGLHVWSYQNGFSRILFIFSLPVNITLKSNSLYIKWSFSIGYFERYADSKSDYLELLLSVQKTKVVAFSTGRTNENVHFTFNGEVIENVKTFNYLGIIFSKGGSFVHTMKNNVNKAIVAMYDILKKGRLFNLSVKCQYDLFEKL